MKRSSSRASKMSTDAQDNAECSLPGIPEKKWQELLEKEETDMFLLGIREEIITNSIEISYQNYLEKQSVAFTVHCAYLAWLKVINMYYMFKDPGDTEDPEVRKTWEPDEEPEASVIDSWGSQCIKAESRKAKEHRGKEPQPEPEKSPSSVESMFTLTPVSKMSSLVSEFFYGEEDDYYYPSSFSESSVHPPSKKSSIFSRTLSMPRELLPMMTPMILCKREKPKQGGKEQRLVLIVGSRLSMGQGHPLVPAVFMRYSRERNDFEAKPRSSFIRTNWNQSPGRVSQSGWLTNNVALSRNHGFGNRDRGTTYVTGSDTTMANEASEPQPKDVVASHPSHAFLSFTSKTLVQNVHEMSFK